MGRKYPRKSVIVQSCLSVSPVSKGGLFAAWNPPLSLPSQPLPPPSSGDLPCQLFLPLQPRGHGSPWESTAPSHRPASSPPRPPPGSTLRSSRLGIPPLWPLCPWGDQQRGSCLCRTLALSEAASPARSACSPHDFQFILSVPCLPLAAVLSCFPTSFVSGPLA